MRQQLLSSKFDAEAARDFVRECCNAPYDRHTIYTSRRNIHTELSRSRSNAPAENRARRAGETRFGRPRFLYEQFCKRRARVEA